jgi:hypothetical protein
MKYIGFSFFNAYFHVLGPFIGEKKNLSEKKFARILYRRQLSHLKNYPEAENLAPGVCWAELVHLILRI